MRKGSAILMVLMALLLVAAACAKATPTPAPATPTPAVAPTPVAAPTPVPTPAKPKYPKMKLRAANFLETTHGLHTSSVFFADRIKELSDGQIEIEIYPTESLIKGRDLLVAGREGVVDMVMIVPFYYPGEFPFWNMAGMLPFSWRYSNWKALQDELWPSLTAEYAKNNLELLWQNPVRIELYLSFEIDADNPSFKGKKLRGFGGASNAIIETFGGDVVFMPSSELAMAVRTKLVDGFGTSLQSWYGLGLMEAAPHGYITDGLLVMGPGWGINKDIWNSYPKEVQDLFRKVAREAMEWGFDYAKGLDEDVLKLADVKPDIYPHILTEPQRQIWKQKLQPVWDQVEKDFPDGMAQIKAALAKHE